MFGTRQISLTKDAAFLPKSPSKRSHKWNPSGNGKIQSHPLVWLSWNANPSQKKGKSVALGNSLPGLARQTHLFAKMVLPKSHSPSQGGSGVSTPSHEPNVFGLTRRTVVQGIPIIKKTPPSRRNLQSYGICWPKRCKARARRRDRARSLRAEHMAMARGQTSWWFMQQMKVQDITRVRKEY